MKRYLIFILTFITLIPNSYAAIGGHIGFGAPYIAQLGLDFTLGDNLTLSVTRNSVGFEIDEVDLSLTMSEVGVKWHPFGGAFFVGAGIGSQTLSAEAEEETTGATASVDVDNSVGIARLGWMWGKNDGGFWFGVDAAYVVPSGGEVEVKADGLTSADQEFQDAQDAGELFAETSYISLTLARLGYLF